ncbi:MULTISPECIES: shikimate dehydrogenase [unclassified Polaromonas]|uniref:shikimate dehydrogenase n=1 Tax=unclassified Polaromonas TaxID=2638319 RepID=UPI0018CAFBFF|nr:MULTISPECIES: shikimate dehydrogenase [unclassified Polaromonas]MBG6071328.1 shikimate dehydrogenase [Polaromonas sp. CG_9.7]MBG6113328.1 shikimate dehydrogenase [Polaromonas sp. CG_9.2]MDH6183216.1 shikimate dehydrogenase [Polaromonas sp. CG_23.6]
MTDRYAVIGNPIHQSKSPLIHGLFALTTGQDMQYTAIEGALGGFAGAVDAFRAAGGRGLNITTPFKLDAFAYATERSERAELAGAANALKFDGDRVLAENFDGIGLVRDVVHNLNTPLRGKRVLMLGAGGAARGALLPFLAQQPAQLVIANRSLGKAQELVRIAMASSAGPVRGCTYQDLERQAFDLVFNATSASLLAEMPPVPASVFAPGCLAYELAYGKGLTPFLRLAQNAGVQQLADGVGMLAEQAAEAFEWWRGVRPDTRAVIERLTVALV